MLRSYWYKLRGCHENKDVVMPQYSNAHIRYMYVATYNLTCEFYHCPINVLIRPLSCITLFCIYLLNLKISYFIRDFVVT